MLSDVVPLFFIIINFELTSFRIVLVANFEHVWNGTLNYNMRNSKVNFCLGCYKCYDIFINVLKIQVSF